MIILGHKPVLQSLFIIAFIILNMYLNCHNVLIFSTVYFVIHFVLQPHRYQQEGKKLNKV